MKYLLDTHTAIWLVNSSENLSRPAESALRNTENQLFLSIASLWEMTIKISIGKLESISNGIKDFHKKLSIMPIEILQINPNYLNVLQTLPFHHKEPFDRLIISTAICEDMTVITTDKYIPKYNISTLW